MSAHIKLEFYHVIALNLINKYSSVKEYFEQKSYWEIENIQDSDWFGLFEIFMDYSLNEIVNNNNVVNAVRVIEFIEKNLNNIEYLEWFMEGFKITKSKENDLLSIWPKSLSPKYIKSYLFPNGELMYKIVPEDDPYWEYIKLESQKVLKLDSKT